ncbi:hypothetical protein ABCR94_13620 [Streptomyces sp. 21So2-11]|uniref:hypothetical protein n=1 Tax=Streptomyces sp. 21So2-11 TaxID=3144408 RepID=UPI00321C24BD
MSGLTSRLPRWIGRRTAATEPEADPGSAAERRPHTVLEEFGRSGPGGADGFLLRSSADHRTSVQELARCLPVERERPVVIVDVAPEAAGNLGEQLGALLGRLRDEQRSAARLVMSGAAARKPDGQLPLAQRLADAWELELEAPDAVAVLVPGGGLYVSDPASPAGGWWRFAPGAEPEALGTRIPAPDWQRALARVPLGELGGHTVRQIPAGLLLHPRGAAAPRPGDLAFALAVHPGRPTVLVSDGPAGDDLAEDLPEDLAALLARLPADLRGRVRLAPGDGHDLLPAAQHVADLLGTEVEVCTGLPLPAPAPASGTTAHHESVRLHSPEGECTWPALLTAVLCAPAEPDESRRAPRPVHWLLPEAVGTADPEPAALRMPGGQYVVAVRAGLWVGGSATPPAAVRDRPAEARAVRIEVEDTATDDKARGALLKALAALLPELDEQVRERAEITAPAGAGPETVTALRRFAVRNGLTFSTTPAPSTPTASRASPEAATEAATAPGIPSPPAESTALPPDTGQSTAAPAPEAPVRPAALASTSVAAVSTAAAVRNSAPAAAATPPAVTAPATRPTTSSSSPTPKRPEPDTPEHLSAVRSGTPTPVSTPAPPATAATPTPPNPAPAPTPAATPSPSPVRASGVAPRRSAPAPVGFSSGADRAAFRELAASVWEEHTGPVHQAFVRLPGLRGPGEDQARIDLIAVHLYLSSPPDGRFGAQTLAAEAESSTGAGELGPYAACLSSGLRRLPALRGTLVRAVPGPAIADGVVPGALLRCAAPLDVVHLEQKGAPLPPEEYVRYVVRPMTARRTAILTGTGGGGAAALFAAGTEFSVLAAHRADDGLPARVLLAEVPSGRTQFRPPSDEALAKMDASACREADASGALWPERCSGPAPVPCTP